MSDVYHSMFDKITLSDEKKESILRLNNESQYSHKRYSIRRTFAIPAACAVALFIFIVGPTKVYADKIFHELIGFITVNKENVSVGQSEWLDLTLPNDMSTFESEKKTCQYKVYQTLADLKDDLSVEFLDLGEEYTNQEIHFQVEEDGAATVNMVIGCEDNDSKLPLTYTLYFSAAKDVSTGQLRFRDVDNSYITYDRNDDEISFNYQQDYDVVEKYKSENLNTNVLILQAKGKYSVEERELRSTAYYAIFVYDKVEYQLYFENGMEGIKDIIEQMK